MRMWRQAYLEGVTPLAAGEVAADVSTQEIQERGHRRGKPLCLGEFDYTNCLNVGWGTGFRHLGAVYSRHLHWKPVVAVSGNF